MRTLKRNERGFWYALFDHVVNDGDEPYNVYRKPVYMTANVSAATGETQTAMFGNSQDYDRVIVTDDLNCQIDENAVLWIDKFPEYDGDGYPTAWDYIVKKVADPLDSFSIAVKKVDVS